jgi:hypothetical protein
MGSYFMMGHDIPTNITVNPRVLEILNLTKEEVCGDRDDSNLASGKGIAFGAFFELNTGNLNFLIFYGQFEFGAGFDIMMTEYPGAHCEGSTGKLGINGWYAKGQAYAYMAGKIGINVKVFGKKKNFDILDLSAAVLFRAQGPNPVYMEGYAGGNYNILGGLVKGKCNFKVTIGEKCVIVAPNSGLQDMKMIGDITPAENTQDVDVFTVPQVVFNVPVNKVLKITNDNNIQQTFRVKLNKCELKNGTQTVGYKPKWNADYNVLVVEPDVIFNPQTNYELAVEIGFEENKNGTWEIFKENGAEVIENQTITFKTGDLPDKIPASAIECSYPINRQYNFYRDEYGQAYCKFRLDIGPFFTASSDRKVQIQWVAANGSKTIGDINYNSSDRILNTPVPPSLLPNTIYSFNIVSVPADQSKSLDKNVTSNVQNIDLQDTAANMNVTTKEAEGTLTNTEEKFMFSVNFRTSTYARFADKLTAGNKQVTFLDFIEYGQYYIGYSFNNIEAFDKFEVHGESGNLPLVRMNGILESTPWFMEEVLPTIYSNSYIHNDRCILWRDTSICGLPPKRDIRLAQAYLSPVLQDDEIQTGHPVNQKNYTDFVYTLARYWSKDYYNLRDYLAYIYPQYTSDDPIFDHILKTFMLRSVKPGVYPVKVEYVLPGTNIVTTSQVVTLQNNFKTSIYD